MKKDNEANLNTCIAFFAIESMAQGQAPWVGTWTSESYTVLVLENSPKGSEGTYRELIKTDYKHSAYKVTRVTGNFMWLETYTQKYPFIVNGQFDSYSDITEYTKLTLNNGTLHYSYYKVYSKEYDRNMNYKGEGTMDVANLRWWRQS